MANVLVIEPNPVTLSIVEGYLDMAGYRSLAIESIMDIDLADPAAPALWAEDRDYDLVIVDLSMLDTGHCESLLAIRDRLGTDDIPVIALACPCISEAPRYCRSLTGCGYAACLIKPLDAHSVHSACAAALGASAA